MHNAEKPNPPASVRDTGGQGELLASSNTRARNSLRAVATHNAPSPGVHGKESKPVAHPCRGPGGQAGDYQKRNGPSTLWRPGNVVGPQRSIIMWHSPPANRPTRRRVRRPGIGSAWHALDATTCYVFGLF